ncbi:hypothetical protein KIS1582_1706 [Cytobacillus firmus]|uniref:Uncharacterized protein n=1 Tax=Cytobacillus firmus TaxID=1399 RepID=A0A800MY91_CYTFI|nr:hypothetical protein KIS1582_1706 [Cytobacillus firmus]
MPRRLTARPAESKCPQWKSTGNIYEPKIINRELKELILFEGF